VSPHRTKRPWQGKKDPVKQSTAVSHDKDCYLCPGNLRAGGEVNPDYKSTYGFANDFSAILPDTPFEQYQDCLMISETEAVVC